MRDKISGNRDENDEDGTKTRHFQIWSTRFEDMVTAGGGASHEPHMALNEADAPGYGRENYTVSHPPPLATIDAFAAGSSYCGGPDVGMPEALGQLSVIMPGRTLNASAVQAKPLPQTVSPTRRAAIILLKGCRNGTSKRPSGSGLSLRKPSTALALFETQQAWLE